MTRYNADSPRCQCTRHAAGCLCDGAYHGAMCQECQDNQYAESVYNEKVVRYLSTVNYDAQVPQHPDLPQTSIISTEDSPVDAQALHSG